MLKRCMKPVALLLALMVFLAVSMPVFAASDYSGSWAKTQIDKWTAAGVFTGYPDGSFKPANPITRAEFAVVLTKLFGYTDKADLTYKDVPAAAWYADYVAKVTAASIMTGSAGKFRPNDPITRSGSCSRFLQGFRPSGRR